MSPLYKRGGKIKIRWVRVSGAMTCIPVVTGCPRCCGAVVRWCCGTVQPPPPGRIVVGTVALGLACRVHGPASCCVHQSCQNLSLSLSLSQKNRLPAAFALVGSYIGKACWRNSSLTPRAARAHCAARAAMPAAALLPGPCTRCAAMTTAAEPKATVREGSQLEPSRRSRQHRQHPEAQAPRPYAGHLDQPRHSTGACAAVCAPALPVPTAVYTALLKPQSAPIPFHGAVAVTYR